jgi:hypothetical protein
MAVYDQLRCLGCEYGYVATRGPDALMSGPVASARCVGCHAVQVLSLGTRKEAHRWHGRGSNPRPRGCLGWAFAILVGEPPVALSTAPPMDSCELCARWNRCGECDGEDFEPWYSDRPCPRCGGEVASESTIMAD